MGSRTAALAVLSSVAGCSHPPERFLASADAQTIIVFQISHALAEAEVIPVSDRTLSQSFPLPSVDQLVVLSYTASLAELNLPQGNLHAHPRGLPVPRPDRIDRLEVSSGSVSEWSSLAELPPEVASLRFDETRPCAKFTSQQSVIPNPTHYDVTFALGIDEQRALVGTQPQGLFQAWGDTARRFANTSTTLPSVAVYRDPSGEIWIGGVGGRIVHGDPDRGFVEAPPVPGGLTVEALDGTRGDGPREIFAATTLLGVYRFADDRWTEIRAPSGLPNDRGRIGLSWIGPGTVALIGISYNRVLEIGPAGEHPFDLTLPIQATPDALLTLAAVDGIGSVVGSRYLLFFVRRSFGWEPLFQPPLTPRADIIAQLGPGSFLTGGQGQFIQWSEGYGLCDPLEFGTGDRVKAAATVGKSLVLFSGGGVVDILSTVLDRVR